MTIETEDNETKVIGIIDDDNTMLLKLEEKIVDDSFVQAFVSHDPESGMSWVSRDEVDLLACDFDLNRPTNGYEVLMNCRVLNPNLPLVLFSAGKVPEHLKSQAKESGILYVDKSNGKELTSISIINALEANPKGRLKAKEEINEKKNSDKDDEINSFERQMADDLYQKLASIGRKKGLKKFTYLGLREDNYDDVLQSIKVLDADGRKWVKTYFNLLRNLSGGKPKRMKK